MRTPRTPVEELLRRLITLGLPLTIGCGSSLSPGTDGPIGPVCKVRHYRLTAAIARQGGAQVKPPGVRRMPVRSLVAMAAENAREGCVRETFGAATAAFQARHAADPRLRAVMTTIARDEARHALLGWEIDAWARAALPPSGARRLSSAREAAARALETEIASAPRPHPSLARALGLPSPAALRRLAADTRDLLWNA